METKYFLFSIPVELGKRCEYVNYNGYQKRCEKVYVKEVDGLQLSNKEVEAVVKRWKG